KYRQSSLIFGAGPRPPAVCMQIAPNSSAFRIPSQRAAGCGARHLRFATGGAANGMPLKTRISALVPALPEICPESRWPGSFTAAQTAPAANNRTIAGLRIEPVGETLTGLVTAPRTLMGSNQPHPPVYAN